MKENFFPIIDLKLLPEDEHQRNELKRGLTDVGFFYVKNWGCSKKMMKRVEELTRKGETYFQKIYLKVLIVKFSQYLTN